MKYFELNGTFFFSIIAVCFICSFINDAFASSCSLVETSSFQIDLTDDASLESLKRSLDTSLRFYDRINPHKTFPLCGQTVQASIFIETAERIQKELNDSRSKKDFEKRIKGEFKILRFKGNSCDGDMLVTGYFEPVLDASLSKRPPYVYPLYGQPPDLVIKKDSQGKIIYGRWKGQEFVPYWSRAEIEKKKILAGQEIVYLKNSFDAFVLHVQGSGRLRLRDGTIRTIRFAAKNGRKYRSIGRLLVDKGEMVLEQVTLPSIKQFLEDHPEEMEEILHYNESYIFFKWSETGSVKGALNESLTAGRSAAFDHDFVPPGTVGFLKTEQPVIDKNGTVTGWKPLERFVFNHDSGSAIKGPCRLDLFWGSGENAGHAAGVMKKKGVLYLLLPK